MKIILIISLLFSFVEVGVCQVFGNELNINYTHFTLNPGAHLSSYKTNDPTNVNVLHQTYTGILSDIKVLYLDAKYDLQANNVIGLKIFNTQKTRELTKSKLHLYYATKVKLQEDVDWSTGAQFGFANAYVGPTRSTAGGSDWALDGSVSTNLKIQNFSIGAALHQLTASSLLPVSAIINLDRYFEILTMNTTLVAKGWTMKNGIKGLFASNFNSYGIDNQIIYSEQLSLLFALSTISTPAIKAFSNYTYSLGGAYKFIYEDKHQFDLSMTYQISDRVDQANAGLVMINLGYTVK